jgi:hypothetical protein
MIKMKGIISHLTDVLGNKYIGLKFDYLHLAEILGEWEDYYIRNGKEEKLELLIENQAKRDGGHYHSTVVTVPEYNKVKQEAQKFLGTEVDFSVLGIGKAVDKNETHFIVITSTDLQNIRTKLGFGKKDFHITVGFHQKDVFTKPKDETSIYINL